MGPTLTSSWTRRGAVLATWCAFVTGSALKRDVGAPQTTSAFVDLGYSQYQGTTLGNGINQYLGLRFAAPPVGDLRWRAPAEPQPTNGTQSAAEPGPICAGINGSPGSEDCLFMNIFTPSDATPASKLPVWVFIQGGGYGVDSQPNYNGSTVIETSGMSIVFVNFNYRVGAFGFLAGNKVAQDGDLNAGLLDQRFALEWVHKYISLFGGDPAQVTIHGASAGAGSVALHLTAHGGRDDGLFAGAIGESVYLTWLPSYQKLNFQFDIFANASGCGGAGDELACLRGANFATLEAADLGLPYPNRTAPPLSYYGPCIDGTYVQSSLYTAFEEGKFVKVPIIFGNDNDEGNYFTSLYANYLDFTFETPESVTDLLEDQFPHLTASDGDAINAEYPLMAPIANFGPYFPSVSLALGESTLVCPGITIVQSFSRYFSADKAWTYRYNVHDDANTAAGLGVPHVFETTAIFGVGQDNNDIVSYTTYNKNIIPVVMNYWISFVRRRDPNPYKFSSAPYWEPFGTGENRIVLETNATRLETVPQAQQDRCAFWRGLARDTQQ